ncbi:MAG: ATP-binding protein [Deltaproteobacteria bacterium]|jgi:hypothetical protein|nr:ATP-binding protein [Deltaproteobacteria bacterium]
MTINQPKQFNVAGPCIPSKHYMLPALPRLTEIPSLIDGENYFVLHAPRQSGKTTSMMAFVNEINEEGRYYALYCSLDKLSHITDVDSGGKIIIEFLDDALKDISSLKKKAIDYNEFCTSLKPQSAHLYQVQLWLSSLATRSDKDLVIFFDEADSLEGQVLLSFLRQLRDGYIKKMNRPFPRSIALIGLRNIRDYKAKLRSDSESMGTSSPFNIITKALTLLDFTQTEIGTLYAQHTKATGQFFEDDAVQRAWYWSEGQPWLVNALAREVVMEIFANDYRKTITVAHIDQAAENLIKRRDTHIDSLLARLHEPRVSRVIWPIIYGNWPVKDMATKDDIDFVLDLGILKRDLASNDLRPANPIYREVIIRTLAFEYENSFTIQASQARGNRWVGGDKLAMTLLLKAFQEYWRENSGTLTGLDGYTEVLPHLVLNAYLQRLINGGVEFLHREYALGTLRLDLLVRYKGVAYPIELKIKANQRSEDESLAQLRRYMDVCGAKEGWLVIFDNDKKVPWEKKISWEPLEYEGVTIHRVGC